MENNLNYFQSFQEDKCNSVNFKDKAIKIILFIVRPYPEVP